MATWDDVRRIALALPEAEERDGGPAQWRIKDKLFAWDRPLRRADLEALGAAAPDGPILAARVPDLGAKDALLADDAAVFFTTPHFNGYPAILVRLDRIAVPELEELLVEAWLDRAPKRLARQYQESHQPAAAAPASPDIPAGVGAPAIRALAAAGYTRLDQLAGVPAAELKQLHGMGPKALTRLQEALEQRGQSLG